MDMLIQNAEVCTPGGVAAADLRIRDGVVAEIGGGLAPAGERLVDASGCLAAPGFTDLHVHLRQPGFEAKETVATGTAAAAAGGFTTVCAMPNLSPVPDDLHRLEPQLEAIRQGARVRVLPYGALTVDEKGECVADIPVLAKFVAGFSDDGRGVESGEIMGRAMALARENGGFVAAHCEVARLLPKNGVCIQADSAFAKKRGFAGFSNESEWAEVERDIALCRETGCPLHICHASTAETFALVRSAKAEGLPVTCEVTPHNLLLCCDDIPADIPENCEARFKMNPPLRFAKDRNAALAALLDGAACAVATDHAPHTPEEKARGFAAAPPGVTGLETAFPALYTRLVLPGILPLGRLLDALNKGPRALLGENENRIEPGQKADFVLLDLAAERVVNPAEFLSRGRASPFEGWALRGWPLLTFAGGRLVYDRAGGAPQARQMRKRNF